MSIFSEKCKSLLVENGTNVYQFSTNFSLDHTTLQRMVTGKRLPKIEFIKKFCHYLRLSHSEKEELLELYRREVIGEDVYENEQAIIQLLENLKLWEDNNQSQIIVSVDLGNVEYHSNITTTIHDTELMLQLLLAEEYMDDAAHTIYSNLPVSYKTFLYSLKMLQLQRQQRLHVHHLIHFQMHTDLRRDNLKILDKILPIFISNTFDYEVFYYYSRMTVSDQQHLLFPYYVITSKHVMLFSADFTQGILLSDPDVIQQYLKEFQNTCNVAQPLFQRVTSLDEAHKLYVNAQNTTMAERNIFHYQPCYLLFADKENVMQKVDQYFPQYRETAEQYMNALEENAKSISNIFWTDQGLNELSQNGQIYGQFGTFFPNLTQKEVLEGLTKYADFNLVHKTDYVLKSKFISFPKSLYFELQGTSTLQIIRIKNIQELEFITIHESSICESFRQFFESIKESKYMYSPEEAEALLRRTISELV